MAILSIYKVITSFTQNLEQGELFNTQVNICDSGPVPLPLGVRLDLRAAGQRRGRRKEVGRRGPPL